MNHRESFKKSPTKKATNKDDEHKIKEQLDSNSRNKISNVGRRISNVEEKSKNKEILSISDNNILQKDETNLSNLNSSDISTTSNVMNKSTNESKRISISKDNGNELIKTNNLTNNGLKLYSKFKESMKNYISPILKKTYDEGKTKNYNKSNSIIKSDKDEIKKEDTEDDYFSNNKPKLTGTVHTELPKANLSNLSVQDALNFKKAQGASIRMRMMELTYKLQRQNQGNKKNNKNNNPLNSLINQNDNKCNSNKNEKPENDSCNLNLYDEKKVIVIQRWWITKIIYIFYLKLLQRKTRRFLFMKKYSRNYRKKLNFNKFKINSFYKFIKNKYANKFIKQLQTWLPKETKINLINSENKNTNKNIQKLYSENKIKVIQRWWNRKLKYLYNLKLLQRKIKRFLFMKKYSRNYRKKLNFNNFKINSLYKFIKNKYAHAFFNNFIRVSNQESKKDQNNKKNSPVIYYDPNFINEKNCKKDDIYLCKKTALNMDPNKGENFETSLKSNLENFNKANNVKETINSSDLLKKSIDFSNRNAKENKVLEKENNKEIIFESENKILIDKNMNEVSIIDSPITKYEKIQCEYDINPISIIKYTDQNVFNPSSDIDKTKNYEIIESFNQINKNPKCDFDNVGINNFSINKQEKDYHSNADIINNNKNEKTHENTMVPSNEINSYIKLTKDEEKIIVDWKHDAIIKKNTNVNSIGPSIININTNNEEKEINKFSINFEKINSSNEKASIENNDFKNNNQNTAFEATQSILDINDKEDTNYEMLKSKSDITKMSPIINDKDKEESLIVSINNKYSQKKIEEMCLKELSGNNIIDKENSLDLIFTSNNNDIQKIFYDNSNLISKNNNFKEKDINEDTTKIPSKNKIYENKNFYETTIETYQNTETKEKVNLIEEIKADESLPLIDKIKENDLASFASFKINNFSEKVPKEIFISSINIKDDIEKTDKDSIKSPKNIDVKIEKTIKDSIISITNGNIEDKNIDGDSIICYTNINKKENNHNKNEIINTMSNVNKNNLDDKLQANCSLDENNIVKKINENNIILKDNKKNSEKIRKEEARFALDNIIREEKKSKKIVMNPLRDTFLIDEKTKDDHGFPCPNMSSINMTNEDRMIDSTIIDSKFENGLKSNSSSIIDHINQFDGQIYSNKINLNSDNDCIRDSSPKIDKLNETNKDNFIDLTKINFNSENKEIMNSSFNVNKLNKANKDFIIDSNIFKNHTDNKEINNSSSNINKLNVTNNDGINDLSTIHSNSNSENITYTSSNLNQINDTNQHEIIRFYKIDNSEKNTEAANNFLLKNNILDTNFQKIESNSSVNKNFRVKNKQQKPSNDFADKNFVDNKTGEESIIASSNINEIKKIINEVPTNLSKDLNKIEKINKEKDKNDIIILSNKEKTENKFKINIDSLANHKKSKNIKEYETVNFTSQKFKNEIEEEEINKIVKMNIHYENDKNKTKICFDDISQTQVKTSLDSNILTNFKPLPIEDNINDLNSYTLARKDENEKNQDEYNIPYTNKIFIDENSKKNAIFEISNIQNSEKIKDEEFKNGKTKEEINIDLKKESTIEKIKEKKNDSENNNKMFNKKEDETFIKEKNAKNCSNSIASANVCESYSTCTHEILMNNRIKEDLLNVSIKQVETMKNCKENEYNYLLNNDIIENKIKQEKKKAAINIFVNGETKGENIKYLTDKNIYDENTDDAIVIGIKGDNIISFTDKNIDDENTDDAISLSSKKNLTFEKAQEQAFISMINNKNTNKDVTINSKNININNDINKDDPFNVFTSKKNFNPKNTLQNSLNGSENNENDLIKINNNTLNPLSDKNNKMKKNQNALNAFSKIYNYTQNIDLNPTNELTNNNKMDEKSKIKANSSILKYRQKKSDIPIFLMPDVYNNNEKNNGVFLNTSYNKKNKKTNQDLISINNKNKKENGIILSSGKKMISINNKRKPNEDFYFMYNINEFCDHNKNSKETEFIEKNNTNRKKLNRSQQEKNCSMVPNSPNFRLDFMPFKGNFILKPLFTDEKLLSEKLSYKGLDKSYNKKSLKNKIEKSSNKSPSKNKKQICIELGINQINSENKNKNTLPADDSYETITIYIKKKIKTEYTFTQYFSKNQNFYDTDENIWFDCTVPFKGNLHIKRKIVKQINQDVTLNSENKKIIDAITKNDKEEEFYKSNQCCNIY